MLPLIPLLVLATHTFSAGANGWLMDGQPYQIRSGEMHYERIPREYWADRLQKARAMGLNTICTYVFWNFHEPEPNQWNFSGDHDVAAFVREAGKQGLNVILRAGPYCCAEWDWGGFPYWLANVPGMQVRQNNPPFLKFASRYLDHLGRQLGGLTINHGGPIILAQVENEYGSFGQDHAYMEAIHQAYLHAGFDCQLGTADGASDQMLGGGTIPGLPAAINFGGGPEGEFAALAKFRTGGPKMNGEFWCGWFDHWGEAHHTTSAEEQAKDMDWMLGKGYSFSLYMFDGGTSFGWYNGANSGGKGHFEPDTTSYDYDAPVSEDGRLTHKFDVFRSTILAHLPSGTKLPDPPTPLPSITIPRFDLSDAASIFLKLPNPVRLAAPVSFEALEQPFGFVLYRTRLLTDAAGTLELEDLQDRALVYLNGVFVGSVDRAKGEHSLPLQSSVGGVLDILVENQGRINFSRRLLDEHKGIKGATLGGVDLKNWEMYRLPFEDFTTYAFRFGAQPPGPTVRRGHFLLKDLGDTYLDMRGWGKGNVWVNGHNLGRYWHVGPQQTLFLPRPYLLKGINEIIVLDVEPTTQHTVEGIKDPVFSAG